MLYKIIVDRPSVCTYFSCRFEGDVSRKVSFCSEKLTVLVHNVHCKAMTCAAYIDIV